MDTIPHYKLQKLRYDHFIDDIQGAAMFIMCRIYLMYLLIHKVMYYL